MILCIGIENSTLLLGLYHNGRCLRTAQTEATLGATADDYALRFKAFLELWQVAPEDIAGTALSSVVPALTTTVIAACKRLLEGDVLNVSAGVRTGLKIKNYPKTLGTDFVCNAVGALQTVKPPFVVVSVGSAVTFSAVDKAGAFCGTAITAGPKLSAEALHQKAAQLPYAGLQPAQHLIATDTASALESGLCFGYGAMIDGMAKRFAAELNQPVSFLLTGEYAAWVRPYCELPFSVQPNLLLDGLAAIWQKNSQS